MQLKSGLCLGMLKFDPVISWPELQPGPADSLLALHTAYQRSSPIFERPLPQLLATSGVLADGMALWWMAVQEGFLISVALLDSFLLSVLSLRQVRRLAVVRGTQTWMNPAHCKDYIL